MHIKMREAFQLRLRARICRSDECSAIRRCFVPDGDAKRLIRPTESREHTCRPDKRSACRMATRSVLSGLLRHGSIPVGLISVAPSGAALCRMATRSVLIRPTESQVHICRPDKRSAIRRCFMPDGDAKRLIRPTESREHICGPDKRSAIRRCFVPDDGVEVSFPVGMQK
ncbi:Uncharacterised protein [Citrobacter koseri]|uniref:Uncharacterized protein n=1 Tax=Citrobacter koseri TaxID=545 RepID=A0A2X2V4P8_CITKO|nr:Uncharacterised protein [Citrobacter koseri]